MVTSRVLRQTQKWLRTFLRTIFDRGYKSSFLCGFENYGRFRIPDISLGLKVGSTDFSLLPLFSFYEDDYTIL